MEVDTMRFRARADAGRRLAERLDRLHLRSPIVRGLPRGGIPVAAEIATALNAPLEVFVARNVGMPGHEELGIGAVAEGFTETILSDTARRLGVGPGDLQDLAARER